MKKFIGQIINPFIFFVCFFLTFNYAMALPTSGAIAGGMFQKCFLEGNRGEEGQACCFRLTSNCLDNCETMYHGATVARCQSACRQAGESCADAFEESRRPSLNRPAIDVLGLLKPPRRVTGR
ncbi:MAG: hypothetical protein HQK49_20315 [Oligoflexia bacterium]|nr:hypothetical protein [Oligoflexia bacterium]